MDAALNLSLGYQSLISRAPKNEEHQRQQLQKATPILEPSLTLGFSDETFAGVDGLARQSSTLTTLTSSQSYASPLGVKRKRSEEAEVERTTSSTSGGGDAGDNEDDDGAGAARRKLRLTKQQSALLEDKFKEHVTLNPVTYINFNARCRNFNIFLKIIINLLSFS